MGRRVLFDALAARYGGGAFAAAQLSRALAAHPRVSEMVVVTRSGSIVEHSLDGAEGVRSIALPAAGRGELAARVAWEALRLGPLVRREDCAAVLTMAGLPAAVRGVPTVCFFCNPVMYEVPTLANRVRRLVNRRTARRAAFVAAPSRSMATLVQRSTGRPCATVPLGVAHDLFRPPPALGSEVLCVGDFYAHKRHDLVLGAWAMLEPPRPTLRLIGNPAVDPSNYARVRSLVAAAPEADSIVLAGRVSLDALLHAYRSAGVFVMPSQRESFCMPLAEAMACGVPVVARDSPSLRETGGDGAVYVDGDTPDRWASAIAALLVDGVARSDARGAALAAAARFSWEACAAAIAEHL